jgi:hypothetical protein
VWWGRSKRLDLFVSGRMMAMRTEARTRTQALAGGEGLAALEPWLAEQPGWTWRVWLGGSLCGLQFAEPIEGVAGMEEAEAALSVSLSAGEPMQARLAIWPAQGEPWLAAVTPAGWVDELVTLVEQHRGRVALCRPWWSAAASRLTGSAAFFDGEAVTYWRAGADGRITSAATQPARDRVQAEQLLQRLRVGGAMSAWQIDWNAVPPSGPGGFGAISINESPDAARAAAV